VRSEERGGKRGRREERGKGRSGRFFIYASVLGKGIRVRS
jgi:hypothetical protein